jgi:hypothetical protein
MNLTTEDKLRIMYEYAKPITTEEIQKDTSKLAKVINENSHASLDIKRTVHIIASIQLSQKVDLTLKKRAFKKYVVEQDALINEVFDSVFLSLPQAQKFTDEFAIELMARDEKNQLEKMLTHISNKNKMKL